MRIFKKIQFGGEPSSTISRENFETADMKTPPWHVEDEKGKIQNYAVCPGCNNPIQLIGLYKSLKNSKHPYGKHTGKRINDFPHFHPEDYKSCLYFNPKLRITQNSRRSKMSPVVVRSLQRLRDDFDRIIALTESFCGFDITPNLAEKMLLHFTNGCHLYEGVNPINIPWIFAYMSGSNNVFGRKIVDEEMKESILRNVSNASFNEFGRLDVKLGTYYELKFNFILHRWKEVDGELEEKMQLALLLKGKKSFFKKEIIFDHAEKSRLFGLIRQQNSKNIKLRKIACEIMCRRFPNLDQMIFEREIS